MAESDEEDYMSDAFLTTCTSSDVRPGLLYNRGEKRKHELLKKHEANKPKPIRVQEKEGREAGLQKEIGAENKGFQLLAKMGYQPGSSLGKVSGGSNDAKRLKEPIPLEMKHDRKGLGQKTKNLEALAAVSKRREELDKLSYPHLFRLRVQEAATQKELKEAQSVCNNLDTQNGIETPIQSWYWPKIEKVETLDSEEKEERLAVFVIEDEEESNEPPEDEPEVPVPEKLLTVTQYLRDQYLYCIWCGTTFDSKDDMLASCPGSSKDEH